MQMKKLAQFAILAIGIAITGSQMAGAQELTTHQPKRVFGYMDENGVFHTPHAMPDASAATTETLTGTLEVTFNITIKSTLPKGYVLFCNAGFGLSSLSETAPTNPTIYSEEGATTTTTTSCTVTIPYSWIVYTPGSTVENELTGTYSVFAVNPTATGIGTVSQLRLVGGGVVTTTTLPANGATTKYTIAVTI